MNRYLAPKFRLIKLILKSKFLFNKPSKKKYLIIDSRNKNLLFRYINKNDSNILYTRGESINLYVLFYSLFSFGFKDVHFSYIKSFIKLSKPEYCITLNHPKVYFYKIKNIYKKITTIAFQNGHTFIFKSKFIANLKEEKKKNKLSADYIFTINKFFTENLFKKYIKSKYFEVGSFKNNFYYKKKINKKRKSIAFISQWRTPEVIKKLNDPYLSTFYNTAEKILPKLQNFSNKNNFKLEIFGSEWDPREKMYYKKILKNDDWIFRKRKKNNYSYQNTDKVEFVVFVDSSLGFESLARGNKTISFYFQKKFKNSNKFRQFGFNFLRNKGKFWTDENNNKEFSRLIDYVKNVNLINWKIDNFKTIKKIMENDPNNRKFQKII